MAPSTPAAPLGALDFHVLLVLSEADLYGYAIMKAVEEQSRGAIVPEIGSLYRVIARLIDEGLVAETDPPRDSPDVHRGRPRRYYKITARGTAAARGEAERLRHVVALAKDLLPSARRA
jgi:DNA-binding PadR family transcriptional regulator